MKKLKVEYNPKFKMAGEAIVGKDVVAFPPQLFEDNYYICFVQITTKQAILLFTKFFTCGIGFLHEVDWNTNLPYTSSAEDIYKHIRHNRLNAKRKECTEAIRMLQEFAKDLKGEASK